MVAVNPVYVPRNWILEEAIKDAENNDFEKVTLFYPKVENLHDAPSLVDDDWDWSDFY